MCRIVPLATSVLVLVVANVVSAGLLPADAVAAEAATVRLLQAPAWRERDGEREALRYGMGLASGDRIVTGERARVLLALEEGSLVKLGADAELDLDTLLPPAQAGGVFEGVMNVLKGAFRFTTTLAGRRRNVRAQVGSATIGIRGTDVWGKSEPSRDFVVLLEGGITIEREGQSAVLDTPLSLFMAPRGEPALPIGPVDQDDLGRWAQETEPQPGSGVRSADGRFVLQLASFTERAGAEALVARLARAGHAAAVSAADVDGRTWYRVASAGFESRADAAHAAARLAPAFGLASPWIAESAVP